MPLYEYSCHSCRQTVELLLSRPDQQAECPQCGGKQLEKLMSVTAAPSTGDGLPVARSQPGMGCGAPRCCGGVCGP